MKLVDKIKQYISSKSKVFDENENVELLYQSILKELKEYKDVYFEEAKKLNGHQHFKVKEVQEKIINLINEDDRVLLIKNQYGRTLGFFACELKLEDVVLRVLDNYESSIIQDENGKNVGMESVSCGLHKAALKALDNKELSCQTMGSSGWNIGMFCAINGFEEGVIKALDNKEASLQQGSDGRNIGMYAAESKLNRATFKALDNYEASIQVDRRGKNIGLWAVDYCDEEVVLKALDNEQASIQQSNKFNTNIGMMAAENGMKRATLKALDNFQASTQQNGAGMNIGMLCAVQDFEEGVLKALDNEVARTQVSSCWKENMSMYAAKHKLLKAVSKSLDFKDVRRQDTGDYTHTRLKEYIKDYVFDRDIREKCDRLYAQDRDDFFEEIAREMSQEKQSEINFFKNIDFEESIKQIDEIQDFNKQTDEDLVEIEG